MLGFDELERDALIEIFNVGAGHAAASMSMLVGEPVRMSVPALSFMARTEAAGALDQRNPDGGRICGISQFYDGAFKSEAILMFPEARSLEIVRLMVGDLLPLAELTELEQEALCEIGNIILNSCVGTLADLFGQQLHGSQPVYRIGRSDEILHAGGGQADTLVLMLHIDFFLERQRIHGYVAFILDVSGLHDLHGQVRRYLQRVLGEQA